MGLPQQKEVGVCVMDPAYAQKDLLVMPLRCETTTAKQFQCKSTETPLSYRNERRLCCAEAPLLLTEIRRKHLSSWAFILLQRQSDQQSSRLTQGSSAAAGRGCCEARPDRRAGSSRAPWAGAGFCPKCLDKVTYSKTYLGTSKASPASR